MSLVRDAAARTLAAGSARVWCLTFVAGEESRGTAQEGVVDMQRRRARIETLSSPVLDEVAERIAERFPWLDEDDEGDDEDDGVSVIAGTTHFYVSDDAVVRFDDDGEVDGPRTRHDPVWIIEALAGAGAGDERRLGEEEVRGEPCTRWATKVEGPSLYAEVWVGRDGLVRRAKWSEPRRGRPRLRPRFPLPRPWTTVELWDFGLPVEIQVPDVEPEPPVRTARAAWDLGSDLWRRRRDYRRRQRG